MLILKIQTNRFIIQDFQYFSNTGSTFYFKFDQFSWVSYTTLFKIRRNQTILGG